MKKFLLFGMVFALMFVAGCSKTDVRCPKERQPKIVIHYHFYVPVTDAKGIGFDPRYIPNFGKGCKNEMHEMRFEQKQHNKHHDGQKMKAQRKDENHKLPPPPVQLDQIEKK